MSAPEQQVSRPEDALQAPRFHIVLHQPEIPSNTGNIGRTCVAAGAALHLIEPLGFRLTEKALARAGMDYWPLLSLHRHMNYGTYLAETRAQRETDGARIWYATTKARRTYDEADFRPGDHIMFGKESAGIPEEILVAAPDHCIRIPMSEDIRSLNLANAAAIVLYEALRQQGFAGLERTGALHRLSWPDAQAGC